MDLGARKETILKDLILKICYIAMVHALSSVPIQPNSLDIKAIINTLNQPTNIPEDTSLSEASQHTPSNLSAKIQKKTIILTIQIS